jgi:hypothetical protein
MLREAAVALIGEALQEPGRAWPLIGLQYDFTNNPGYDAQCDFRKTMPEARCTRHAVSISG